MLPRAPSYLWAALPLLVSGCFVDRVGTAPPDAAMVDAAMVDAAMVDAAMVDAAMVDATTVDAATVDAGRDAGPLCGNGIVDPGEECDGTDLAGADCATYGLTDGALQCSAGCTHALMACVGCGNGRVEAGEDCDGADLGVLSCTGGIGCDATCLYDTATCTRPSAGDGSDGTLTVTSSTDLDEDNGAPRFEVDSIAGSTLALDSDPVGLAAGDEVILINMRGSRSDCGSVGRNETGIIASISARDVTLASAVSLGYGVGGSNADLSGQRIMLQRIPHFDRVEITGAGSLQADTWDGSDGGLVAFRARVLVIEASGRIEASRRGFRGGSGWDGDSRRDGRRGESICGDPQDRATTPNDGGGGGGRHVDPGDGCGQGGGGGGHGTVGGSEGFPSSCIGAGVSGPAANGGSTLGTAMLDDILLGSGGGAGASDDHSDESGSGGRGGGFILVWVADATIDGRMLARGANGLVPGDTTDSGNGGGGAGGAIVLRAGALSGSGTLETGGGNGPASTGSWNSAGGDGGDGRIRVDYWTANGERFGSSAAAAFVDTMTLPSAGSTARYLD